MAWGRVHCILEVFSCQTSKSDPYLERLCHVRNAGHIGFYEQLICHGPVDLAIITFERSALMSTGTTVRCTQVHFHQLIWHLRGFLEFYLQRFGYI